MHIWSETLAMRLTRQSLHAAPAPDFLNYGKKNFKKKRQWLVAFSP